MSTIKNNCIIVLNKTTEDIKQNMLNFHINECFGMNAITNFSSVLHDKGLNKASQMLRNSDLSQNLHVLFNHEKSLNSILKCLNSFNTST